MHWKDDGRPGVYRLQHLETGNFYIGSTKNLYRRWKRHQQLLRHAYPENIKIAQDVKEYGEKGFCIGVLEYCNEKELLDKEQYYYEQMKPFYNVWKNIYSAKGREYSAAQLKNFKKSSKHIKDVEGFKKKLREAWVKRKSSLSPEELTKKMSAARKGILHSEETKKLYSLQRKGVKKSKQHSKKVSEARTGTKLINGKWVKVDHGL